MCFFYLVKSFPLSQIEPISDACLCDVTQSQALPRLLIDISISAQTGLVSYLRPALSELSSCLNAFMFARNIHDPVSPPEEVSVRFFNESLQIAFPNNVLVSKFHDECV